MWEKDKCLCTDICPEEESVVLPRSFKIVMNFDLCRIIAFQCRLGHIRVFEFCLLYVKENIFLSTKTETPENIFIYSMISDLFQVMGLFIILCMSFLWCMLSWLKENGERIYRPESNDWCSCLIVPHWISSGLNLHFGASCQGGRQQKL